MQGKAGLYPVSWFNDAKIISSESSNPDFTDSSIDMARYAKTEQYSVEENVFWERFIACAGHGFLTLKGLSFRFEVCGNEVFFDRKEKSVTRATVMQGYRNALKLLKADENIDGPKKLGVFGASYLFPVFHYLGLC